MKTFLVIICGVLAVSGISSADEDPVAHSSPDGSVTIRNIGNSSDNNHHFQIVGRDGGVILSSDKHAELEAGSFAENIRWSADGHYAAFSVRTSGPHIRDTFVYSVKSKRLLKVPTKDDDYQTLPVRWHQDDTLIVETNAPVGGKSTKESALAAYRYRRTIRLSGSPVQLETLYTSPITHPYRNNAGE